MRDFPAPGAPRLLDWALAAFAVAAIPAALFGVAATLDPWIRLAWWGAQPLALAAALAALMGLGILVPALRFYLDRAPAFPWPVQAALDFLALRRWPRSTVAAALVLAVLPGLWWAHSASWILGMRWSLDWYFRSGDLHDALDSLAVAYQFTVFAGTPVLAGHFVLARRWRHGAWLGWLLLPLALAATVLLFVVLSSIVHLMFM